MASNHTVTQFAALAYRSTMRTLREPAVLAPNIIFPLIFFLVLAGGVQAAAGIPGFPTDSYTDFAFTAPFIQGALLAAISAAALLARDIETGFLDRLLLTPAHSLAILFGQMMGAAALAACQVTVFLVVGLVLGVEIQAGVGGVIVLYALVILVTIGLAGIGAFVALRTGSAEAVMGIFPMFFALMFLSSLTMPRELIEADWFRFVATINPLSYVIEGIRSLVITGWDWEALGRSAAVLAGILILGMWAATSGLRGRVART
jgi:ABC-2 type transport system permease protein